jgi:uncharacterized Ntn-hydrolase superfamily protein/pimeloyl-ACP methyl ester carboxylesterase
MKSVAISVLGALTALHGPAQSRTVNVGDAVINYEIVGVGDPLVLIHGWAQDLSIWDDQVREFSKHYRVLRYDRRGFGRSTGHADASADPQDLRTLLDSLGIQKAHVLGLSAGSVAALNFAVAFPDRLSALVLYGQMPPPGFTPMPEGPNPVMIFSEIARRHGLDSVGKVLRAHPLAWMPPDRPDLQEMLRAQWARYDGRDLLDPRPESGRVPAARMDQLGAIRVPTLVISGDHELPLFRQVGDTLVNRIPGARRAVITNGGHGAHFAQPAQFNVAVLGFLGAVSGRQPLAEWPPVATFSILAMDSATGEIGGAVQSRVFSVGNGVLWAEAGVGAAATQAIVDVSYGPKAIAALREGLSAAQVVARVMDADPDPRPDDWSKLGRQFAVVDARGSVFAHTGPRASAWAGHKSCSASGSLCTAQGNILASEAVVDSMVAAYERTAGQHISLRLVEALEAGQRAGGDRRGMQSAAILVVKKNGGVWLNNDVVLRLQVDDNPEPIVELRRLVARGTARLRRP